MCAQGKLAFAYANMRADNAERSRGFYAGATSRDAAGLEGGPDGIMIKDMGFIDNLMLHGCPLISTDGRLGDGSDRSFAAVLLNLEA